MYGLKGDMHWNKEGHLKYFSHSREWLAKALKG